jgi:hypothetical protein
MCNPVRAFATCRAEHRTNSWVSQSIVDVGEPVLIAAGKEVAPSVEHVSANFDF